MDTLAEWLRRRPAKPMGSPRVGSNPTGVDVSWTPGAPLCAIDPTGVDASWARGAPLGGTPPQLALRVGPCQLVTRDKMRCGRQAEYWRNTNRSPYTWPGSNWRPSACEADVIATRPQVL